MWSWWTSRHSGTGSDANPHLLINGQTAMETGPVSGNWTGQAVKGLNSTLEQLRIDRQLEEALTHGPDPLHLAAVFGLSEPTAIRYAESARQLLTTPAELHPAAGSLVTD